MLSFRACGSVPVVGEKCVDFGDKTDLKIHIPISTDICTTTTLPTTTLAAGSSASGAGAGGAGGSGGRVKGGMSAGAVVGLIFGLILLGLFVVGVVMYRNGQLQAIVSKLRGTRTPCQAGGMVLCVSVIVPLCHHDVGWHSVAWHGVAWLGLSYRVVSCGIVPLHGVWRVALRCVACSVVCGVACVRSA